MFLQVSVCPPGGGWVSQDALPAPPPRDGEPPRWRTPPDGTPPDGEPPPMQNPPPRMPDGEPYLSNSVVKGFNYLNKS